MFKGWKRLTSWLIRHPAGTTAGKTDSALHPDQEILGAIWQALNIARDNKGLVIARAGTIININSLVSQLCGRSFDQLVGGKVTTELFDSPSVAAAERWETALRTSSGNRIAVEVTRQSLDAHLSDIEVYAIRDLRGRQEAAEERERQSRALQQREEESAGTKREVRRCVGQHAARPCHVRYGAAAHRLQ